jgi:hypothetical protein
MPREASAKVLFWVLFWEVLGFTTTIACRLPFIFSMERTQL